MKKTTMKAAAAFVLTAVSAATAVEPYDEPRWPAVTPDYEKVAVVDWEEGYSREKLVEMMAPWKTPLRSEVKMVNGAPEMFVNGEQKFMSWGTRTKYDNKGLDYNFVTVWNYSYEFAPKVGTWNFEVFDRRAYAAGRQFPKAMFVWQLQVYPSRDWGVAHDEDRLLDEKGERRPYWGDVNVDYSFASDAARARLVELTAKAIEYLEKSPYANRIAAYRVASAFGVEWITPSAKGRRIYDHSKHAKEKFRKWCAVHYPELKDPVPPTYEDMKDFDDGLVLFDRRKHLQASAFVEFYSGENERTMIEVVKAAKEATGGKKVVGTYHGYTFYHNWNGYSQQVYTYNFKQSLDAGWASIYQSPQNYQQRRPGGSFADMKSFGTLRMNGLVSVCENDLRTSYGPKIEPASERYMQMPTQHLSRQLLRRDFATEMCRRNPIHHINHPNSIYMDGLVADMKEMFRTGEELVKEGVPARKPEIALVVSEKSICSLPNLYIPVDNCEYQQEYQQDGSVTVKWQEGNLFNTEIYNNQLDKWNRCGAPVDYVLAEDMKDHPGDYRLYVFLCNMNYDEDFRLAVEKLKARGATLLWTWSPGWSTAHESGLGCMKGLTGIEFGMFDGKRTARVVKNDGKGMGLRNFKMGPLFYPVSPADEVLGKYEGSDKVGLARFRQGKSDVYFSGTWQLDMDFICGLVRRCGIFTYSDSRDPMEANEKLFTLHARYPGVKTVRLPKKVDEVYDVFNRRVVARDTDTFSFDAKLHETWFFRFR